MDIFKWIILVLVTFAGVMIGHWLAIRHKLKKYKKAYNDATDAAKEKEKEFESKVMDFLEKNEKITNNDVEKLLNVSDATATRYLQHLEDKGKIKQVGETGKYVHYVKI